MIIIDDNNVERVAYVSDFNDVQITFTPDEWQELIRLFEFRLQTKPSTEAKATGKIYKKLIENKPSLKSGLKIVEKDFFLEKVKGS